MSVGTPLLTSKLPGIPDDHYPYVYLIKKENKNGIFTAISSVLDKSDKELHLFGKKAKDFTINKKNNVIQTKKIIELIKKSY